MATAQERKLIEKFRELGVMPHADTAEDLKDWLKNYHGDDSDDEGVKTVKLSNYPKVSTFYGDVEKLSKGEVIYDQWKYEIESLVLEGLKESQILQAIRRSVKGGAARVLKRLRPGCSVNDILKKFESVYGGADSKATILRNFYSAEQEDGENIREWSCRLEELMDKAQEKGLIVAENVNTMLCDKFWSGMKRELREITGHKYDTIKDFDTLRSEVKNIELEHSRKDKPSQSVSKSAVKTEDDSIKSEMQELRSMIKSVATSVNTIGEELQELSTTVHRQQTTRPKEETDRRDGYSARGQSDYNRYDRNDNYRRQRQDSRNYDRPPQQRYQNSRQPSQRSEETQSTHSRYQDNQSRTERGPMCYRCRQYGHFQWQCRVRLDHSKHLN